MGRLHLKRTVVPIELRRGQSGTPFRIELSHRVGEGGEATVWALPGDEDKVVKLYKRPSPERKRKLDRMIAHPPRDPSVAQGHRSIIWPEEIVVGSRGQFAGFVMLRAKEMQDVCDIYTPKVRRRKVPGFTFRYMHRIAQNLATAVAEIHRAGYVIGDVNESNFLVTDRALITVVDTDSFQVRDATSGAMYRCPVGKPDFTPPELIGKRFDSIDRTVEHDLFGLGVVMFHLLMEGLHPFDGVINSRGDPPGREERISRNLFLHAPSRGPQIKPAKHYMPFVSLDPVLQDLVIRCFSSGHRDPSQRPAAADWVRALASTANALRTCERTSMHVYFAHNASCPWCDRAAIIGKDPFPDSHAGMVQTPLPRRSFSSAPVASASAAPKPTAPTQSAPPPGPSQWAVPAATFTIASSSGGQPSVKASSTSAPGTVAGASAAAGFSHPISPRKLAIGCAAACVIGAIVAPGASPFLVAAAFATVISLAVIVHRRLLTGTPTQARKDGAKLGAIGTALIGLIAVASNQVFGELVGAAGAGFAASLFMTKGLGRTALASHSMKAQAALAVFPIVLGTFSRATLANDGGGSAVTVQSTGSPVSAPITAVAAQPNALPDPIESTTTMSVVGQACPRIRVCLFEGASTEGSFVAVDSGAQLASFALAGQGWYSVELETGTKGFVRSRDLARLRAPVVSLDPSLIP